jgi:hypothetical protein
MTGSEKRLRDELEWVRGKYDCGAVPDAIYQVIRNLENDISWMQHNDRHGPPTYHRVQGSPDAR